MPQSGSNSGMTSSSVALHSENHFATYPERLAATDAQVRIDPLGIDVRALDAANRRHGREPPVTITVFDVLAISKLLY
jgi:hypothetical protein